MTDRGGKIVWLTRDIRAHREIPGFPAVLDTTKSEPKHISHACKLFEQALLFAAGGNKKTAVGAAVVSTATTAEGTPIAAAADGTQTSAADGSTAVQDKTVFNFSDNSIDVETRSAPGPQNNISSSQQQNNNQQNNNNQDNNNMFPIVVTLDMTVLQYGDSNISNSKSSSNNVGVLGLSADELLEMARIAGANEHVSFVMISFA